jgi:hypothetical protein
MFRAAVKPSGTFTVRLCYPQGNEHVSVHIGRIGSASGYDDVVKMLPFHKHGLDLLKFGMPKHHRTPDSIWTFSAPGDRQEDYITVVVAVHPYGQRTLEEISYTTREGEICSTRAYLHRCEYYKRGIVSCIRSHPHLQTLFATQPLLRIIRRSVRALQAGPAFSIEEALSTEILDHMRLQKESLYALLETPTESTNGRLNLFGISRNRSWEDSQARMCTDWRGLQQSAFV